MTRPFFTRDRISHFALFDRHAEEAIALVKQRLREGHPVDFAVPPSAKIELLHHSPLAQDLFSKFTMDSATEFLFGMNVHSLSGGLAYPYYVVRRGMRYERPSAAHEAFAIGKPATNR